MSHTVICHVANKTYKQNNNVTHWELGHITTVTCHVANLTNKQTKKYNIAG